MRYSSDHKAQTRERILQIAAATIRAHGVDRVSLADIMSGADLTKGGFYAHFSSRDDLIAEAISFMFDERYARMLARVDAPNPRQALTAFIDYYLSEGHRDTPKLGCPIPILAAGVPHMSVEAKRRFSAGVARLIQGLATLLEHAGVAEPQMHANSMLSELAGALNLARSAEQADGADAVLTASRSALRQRLGLIANA